jgi:hypothetical protein
MIAAERLNLKKSMVTVSNPSKYAYRPNMARVPKQAAERMIKRNPVILFIGPVAIIQNIVQSAHSNHSMRWNPLLALREKSF